MIPCGWGLFMTSIAGQDAPKQISRLWTMEDLIDAQQHKLVPIASAGVGCVLISRKALEKVSFLTSKEYGSKYPGNDEIKTHTDYLFYAEALKQGFTAFLAPNHMTNYLPQMMHDDPYNRLVGHAMPTEGTDFVHSYSASVFISVTL